MSDRVDLGRVELPLRVVGLAVWAFIGTPRLESGQRGGWIAPWLLYAAAYCATMFRALPTSALVVLLLVQSLSALILPYAGLPGFEGLTLAIVAVEAAAVLPFRAALGWTLAQALALLAAVVPLEAPRHVIEIVGAYSTFAAFALAMTHLREREIRARRELAHANGELIAVQGLLVESSLVGERLRISRELHDTVGHHLAVLSIQLDLASRLAEGKAAEAVKASHAISREMLSEVRAVVGALRDEGAVDLGAAVKALAAGIPEPKIRCDARDDLRVPEPSHAHALFRCAQEVITNAVKHAEARNVWLSLDEREGGILLEARDDGRGAKNIREGAGLSGMRERIEALGGTLVLSTTAGHGFEVRAWLPGRRSS